MTSLSTQEILRSARDLPALPAIVMELIQCMGDPHANMEQLAVKISHDQALASKTLRLANSSFYGLSRQVTSIAEATTILGLRTLRSIATAAGLVGGFPRPEGSSFDFAAFWRHSIGTALCARSVAQAARLDEDAAFTLGLLHDIGRLVLATHYSAQYAAAMAYRREQDCLNLVAEQHILGTNHTVVGGLIAEHWNFSPAIVAAIVEHHSPPETPEKSLTDVVHVADNIAHAMDLSHQDGDMVPALSLPAWSRLGLGESAYAQVFYATEQQYESVCQILLT
ncbi:putative nucleotidyltransferase with HDIG domain [Rhodoferax ferrireducens]|uniref:Nucleotidyltransferase with HDIG domain n=1 Tax=Rhodoferax ferrireducens TaxID=192843 RepID=A0ABU2CEX0_9BURK|nr:HDOD domain-containing protein [Rhodoferax ferrireducens]MDR7379900.1 putative nucleotidyltransferase with HDIG domain [Rhodoferax ferrireducens]